MTTPQRHRHNQSGSLGHEVLADGPASTQGAIQLKVCRSPVGVERWFGSLSHAKLADARASRSVLCGPADRLQQLCEWHYAAMQGQDLIDRQLQTLDVFDQIHAERVCLSRLRCVGWCRSVRVGFDQQPLLRELRHDEPLAVGVVLHEVQRQGPGIITQHRLIVQGFDGGLLT